jgi:hypothetical protein
MRQLPNELKMQQTVYRQLTGGRELVDASTDVNGRKIKDAMAGKRLLLILDE